MCEWCLMSHCLLMDGIPSDLMNNAGNLLESLCPQINVKDGLSPRVDNCLYHLNFLRDLST